MAIQKRTAKLRREADDKWERQRNEEADKLFPQGYRMIKPYLLMTRIAS